MKNVLRALTVLIAATGTAWSQCALTIDLRNANNNSGFAGVPVSLVAFNASGEPDPAATQILLTEVSGTTSTIIQHNRDYQLVYSTPGYGPSIRDQIMDPGGNFRIRTADSNLTKTVYLYSHPGGTNNMFVSVSSLSAVGQMVLLEVFINNQNREPMAYAIGRATATDTTQFRVENLFSLPAGAFGVRASEPGRGRAVETIMGASFPQTTAFAVDLTGALPASKFEDVRSTSAASVEGVLLSTANVPITGARVTMSQYLTQTPNGQCNCILPTFLADSFSDSAGRFRFFDVPASSVSYNLFASKLGFYSIYSQVNRPLPTTPTIRFNFLVQAATYSVRGQMRYNGVAIPAGEVFTHGDYDTWAGTDTYAHRFNSGSTHDGRVKVNGDGSFAIDGIPDGNVDLSVLFRGGQYRFNEGANGQRNFSGSVRGGDDLRVTVTSTTYTGPGVCATGCPAGTSIVFNAAGLSLSSGTVIYDISPPGGAVTGVITGTITFITTYTVSAITPVFVSTNQPVAVLATQDYSGGNNVQRIGVATLAGTFTSKTTTYTILVSTGYSYRTDIFSTSWAKATDLDDQADLRSTGTAVLHFDLVRAGRLIGQVRLPDGSNFRPVNGPTDSDVTQMINIRLRGITSDGRCDVLSDDYGAFECPNLAPGTYQMTAESFGGAAVWPKVVRTDVVVYEGKTTSIVVKLKDALYVQPQIFGLPTLSTASWHFKVVAFPAGFKLNQTGLAKTFINDDSNSLVYSADYSTVTATWETMRMEPGLYDFYLLLEQSYRPEPESDGRPTSFFNFENFIGQQKNMAVQKSESNPNLGTKSQPIALGILGSIGQATVTGLVRGSKLFTLTDLARIYANFNEIFLNLPAVILYDAAGDLKGYSAGLPSETGFPAIVPPLKDKNTADFLAALAANPLSYRIAGLPPGKYTAVYMNPNYPPVVHELNLASGSSDHDVNFDNENVLTGTVRGIVISSSTGQALSDATVSIKHRSLERVRRTGADGRFSIENLPPGVYRVEAAKGGFTTAGDKAALSANGTLTVNLALHPTTSTIRGTVFLRKFPTPAVKDGVRIVAYDETANVANPEAYLPHLSVETGDDGTYEIPGVLPGHVYKITALTPGKLLEALLVTAVPGVTQAQEIVLKDSPPEITVKVRRSLEQIGKVDIVVKSPKELRAVPAGSYNPGDAYDESSVSALTFITAPENSFLGRFTPSPTLRYYTIRITAGEEQNQLTKTVVYDQQSDARSEQFVHENAIAGGEVNIDEEKEDYSGIELDAGSLTISTGTASADFSNLIGGFFSSLPSVRMVKTDRGTSDSVGSLLEGLLASEVYTIDLSSAQQNKSLTLTLKYDKAGVTDTGALRIRQYNSATGEWDEVPGNYTVDPLTGVVSVSVESIQDASAGSGATAPLRRSRFRAAVSKQGTFVPSATASSSQTGQFAVFSAAPPTGVSYGGGSLEIYNLPNPFNLKSKTVNLSTDRGSAFSGTTTDVRGTLIKYHLPAAKSGHLKLLIYNIAGELVRSIDEGSRTGGQIYYSEWDGKNDDGSDCASGVYFLLTQVDGKKIGGKAHKMALVK